MSADLKKLFSAALRVPAFLGATVCSAVLCYYIAGAVLTNRIDLSAPKTDRPDDQRAVLAALIERETVKHVYTPDPLFYEPAAVLDNMPAFQQGIIAAAARLTEASGDAEAAALLSEPADRRASAAAFRRAAVLLREKAGENASPIPLRAVRDLIADARERLLRHVLRREMYFIDLKADDVFYFAKGELYTAFLVLRAAKRGEGTETGVEKALFLLQRAVALQPPLVLNVSPSSQFAPNHLAGAGFYAGGALEAVESAEGGLK